MNVRDAASAVVQAAPPVAVSTVQYFSHPLSDWIMYGTGVYLVLQFVVIAPKVWRTITGKERK